MRSKSRVRFNTSSSSTMVLVSGSLTLGSDRSFRKHTVSSLVQRCADSLRPNGRLLIHHVLLNDLSRDHVSMHDCLPESELRTRDLAPQVGFEPTTLRLTTTAY